MAEVKSIDLSEIFKNHIKIEPKVMAIETLFNNRRRFGKTNYKPPYQRNYVWTDDKASYFIESILLGTEIPPLIFFNSGDVIEVIDGRQRYETIYRFIKNQFKLRKGSLLKLQDLTDKKFNELGDLRDIIYDTKIRIIEFSFHTKPESEYDIEDIVKKEIFKRYNTGITPLKPAEIDKAKYIEDDLNLYIKKTLKQDKKLLNNITQLFSIEQDNIEAILKKIRQLLVQFKIPINYFAIKKHEVINKFYELLSETTDTEELTEEVFNNFIKKVEYVADIKKSIEKLQIPANRLMYECIFWALSVIENENINLEKVSSKKFKTSLIQYINENIGFYKTDRSSFYEQIIERYKTTAAFFEKELKLSLTNYIINHQEFRQYNKSLFKDKTDADTLLQFDTLRLNKPDASSNSIEDVCHQMKRQRFFVRPIYQRNEVINKNKSSAIIESILLGIKLPPIFVFKRKDGVAEVIDGQQRLLSILGFLGKDYLDENKKLKKSDKNRYGLNLKDGILKDLHRKKFHNLSKVMKDRILDYDLWVIEIDEKNNPNFDKIDLFIRLNHKPYPIKENTFEMWNSYCERSIIETVKKITKSVGTWFYLRVDNARMENEGLIMSLIYLEYKLSKSKRDFKSISSYLDTYKLGDKIIARIKSKNDITKVLDSPESKQQFLMSCESFEKIFLAKVKALISEKSTSSKKATGKLEELLLLETPRRTHQMFYVLWLMLANISIERIKPNREPIIKSIKAIYRLMKKVETKKQFEDALIKFWHIYK